MSGDPNLSLVVEAKRCKYTLIPKTTTYDEVLQIWLTVSQFIIRRLVHQKAVNIPGLGLFSVLKRKLDIGNNGKLCIQRPVFIVSEKFAQTHGITYTKYQSVGEIPVIQLNYAVIATETGFERDLVEVSIKELISAFSRTINTKKKGELTFKDVGRIVVKEGKAKMKFAKDFLKIMDGSSSLTLKPLSLSRPRTSDTFISQESVMSSTSSGYKANNLVLPKIKTGDVVCERPPSVISYQGGGLTLSPLEAINETDKQEEVEDDSIQEEEDDNYRYITSPMLIPPSTSTWDGDLNPCDPDHMTVTLHKRIKTDLKPNLKKRKTKGESGDETSVHKNVQFKDNSGGNAGPVAAENSCSHQSGQELCYLCHQRQRRNIPISFAEEKKRYGSEQDRVLQQYQQLKDQEFNDQENKYIQWEREICKDVAQFNLAASEKLKLEQAPSIEFHHSYIFDKRGDASQCLLTHDQYSRSLGEQVQVKTQRFKKLKDERDRLEQDEQRYLAAELADARKRYLQSKALSTKQYQSALYTQVKNKPFQLPKAEPDSDGPIFGRMDMTADKVAGMRKRAKEVLNHQLQTIKEKKEKSRREKEQNKRNEIEILNRTKKELREDSYKRFQVTKNVRQELENSWTSQHTEKRRQDALEKKHQMTAGLLLLNQCNRYARCDQCKRCCDNIGTSNVWRESRYISGSRLMV